MCSVQCLSISPATTLVLVQMFALATMHAEQGYKIDVAEIYSTFVLLPWRNIIRSQ